MVNELDGHKMQYHPQEVIWTLKRENFAPIYVEISPVGWCNHNCKFCALDHVMHDQNVLSTTSLLNTISSMGAFGVKSIMFAGEGEPMLHEDINDFVDCAYFHGIDVAFTTNASKMNEEFVNKSLYKCSWIKVSCNAGDEQTYAKIHRANHSYFNIAWRNIAYALRFRKENNIKTKIGVQTVLLPDNVRTIFSLIEKCINTGVDYIVIKPYSHNRDSETTEYKDLKYVGGFDIDTIEKSILERFGNQFVSSNCELIIRKEAFKAVSSEIEYKQCHAVPFLWAYIQSNGDVYGCSAFLKDPRFCYGNINDSSFKDIWLGNKRENAKIYMGCHDISECRKACRMNQVNKYLNDVKHPHPHRNFI